MKKLVLPFLFSLALAPAALASDDNIVISNLYNAADPNSYWTQNSSDVRQYLFKSLTRELGIAISHKNLAPGESLGRNGVEVGLDTSLALITPGQRCKAGEVCTEDGSAVNQKYYDQRDAWRLMDTDHRLTFGDVLLIPTLHVRKGLPFSTEVGMDLSYLAASHQTALSGYGRVALHEGMWDRTWRVVPDVALSVSGTRFMGNPELDVSVLQWNLTAGWTFPVGGIRDSYIGTFSPFLGLGTMYITAVPFAGIPSESLAPNLQSLQGSTGLSSKENADPADGPTVVLDPAFRPSKFNLGMRIASGRFRLVLATEITRGTKPVETADETPTKGFDRPSVTLGFGFLY